MGIDTNWKKIIKKSPNIFGECFTDSVADDFSPTVIVRDLNLDIRSFGNGMCSWEELRTGFELYIKHFDFRATTIILCVDEPDHVPCAKEPEQRRRSSSFDTLSTEDIKQLEFGRGSFFANPVPENERKAYSQRIFNTRAILKWIFSYIAYIAVTTEFPNPMATVIVDGPDTQYINMLQKKRAILPNLFIFNLPSDPADCCIYRMMPAEQNDVVHRRLFLEQSSRIGEADLKIARQLLGLIPLETSIDVLVQCKDTDLIPILLLNMRSFMHKSPVIPVRLILDLSNAYGQGEYLDVRQMWQCIQLNLLPLYPHVKHPVETIVLLMVMSKTDYVANFKGVGSATVWKFFFDKGHSLMYPPLASFPIKDGKFNTYGSFLCPPASGILRVSKETGLLTSGVSIAIAEEVFIKVSRALLKNDTWTNDELRAQARRCWWQLDYWANCAKFVDREKAFYHPLKSENGVSFCGWERNEEGDVVPAKKVCDAK